MQNFSEDVLARFWAKVDKTGLNGCWLWTAAKGSHGYGQFSLKGRPVLAHRLSYELFKGEVPAGVHLDHLCRTPACVRPDHLEAVSPGENVRRGLVKGQKWTCGQTWTRGENQGSSKLTEAQVLAIRADPRLARLIADDFGIHRAYVSAIKNRKVWAWIPAHNEDTEQPQKEIQACQTK